MRLSTKQLLFLENWPRQILLVFGLLVFISLGFFLYKGNLKKEEEKVKILLYDRQQSLHKLVKQHKEKNKESKKEKDAKGDKTKDLLKDLSLKEKEKTLPFTPKMKQMADLYEQNIRKNKTKKIVVAFAIDLADFYYRTNQKDKATDLLLTFAFPKRSSSMYHLAAFQLATYYMDGRECLKALPLLQDLSLNPKAKYLHLESRLQSAICLESMDRFSEALKTYEDVLNKDPDGYTGHLATGYKKALVLHANIQKSKTDKKD